MNKEDIYRLFKSIANEQFTSVPLSVDVKNKLSSYVQQNTETKSLVDMSFENNRLHLYFKPFDIQLTCKESFKLYSFPPIIATCIEMDFVYKQNNQDKSLIKIYLTEDGYIVKDLFDGNSIAKANNEYIGKKVFDEILTALISEKLVVVSRKQSI